jgi:hypothetical protein
VRRDGSISAHGARRLLEAAPSADPREQQVAAVLTALAPQDASGAPVPDAVLAAFADHARSGRSSFEPDAGRGHGCSGARMRRAGRAATIKAGIVVLAISSGTATAAAADILPAPAQRAAHSLFGSWGVPAPHASHGAGTVSPSAPAVGTRATGTPGTGTGTGTARPSAARPVATPSADGTCPDAGKHGAGAHCEGSAAAGTAPATAPAMPTAGAGRATKSDGHGHAASARSDGEH